MGIGVASHPEASDLFVERLTQFVEPFKVSFEGLTLRVQLLLGTVDLDLACLGLRSHLVVLVPKISEALDVPELRPGYLDLARSINCRVDLGLYQCGVRLLLERGRSRAEVLSRFIEFTDATGVGRAIPFEQPLCLLRLSDECLAARATIRFGSGVRLSAEIAMFGIDCILLDGLMTAWARDENPKQQASKLQCWPSLLQPGPPSTEQ